MYPLMFSAPGLRNNEQWSAESRKGRGSRTGVKAGWQKIVSFQGAGNLAKQSEKEMFLDRSLFAADRFREVAVFSSTTSGLCSRSSRV